MSLDRRADPFVGSYEGDCLTDGTFAVPMRDGRVLTHLGERRAPQPLRFVTVTNVGGFKFCGQGQSSGTWEWIEAEQRWNESAGVPGERPFVYDHNGRLHVAPQGPNMPADGYTHVDANNNPVYTVRYDAANQINEATPAGQFLVGQGRAGGIKVIDSITRNAYLLESGNVRTIWARMENGMLAVATRRLDIDATVLIWIPIVDVFALPRYQEAGTQPPPTDLPPPPPPPIIVTRPPPVTQPGGTVGPFSWDSAIVRGDGSPDFRHWPETAQITEVNITGQHEAFRVSFTKEAAWPRETPQGWEGGISYTLGMALWRNSAWHLATPIECWHGDNRGFGGPPQEVGKNWFDTDNPGAHGRWAPMDQPRVGETVGMFVTRGTTRLKNVPGGEERSNVEFFQWPAGPQRFTFLSAPADPPPVDDPADPPPTDPGEPGGGDTGGGTGGVVDKPNFGEIWAAIADRLPGLMEPVLAQAMQPALERITSVAEDAAAMRAQLDRGFAGSTKVLGQKVGFDIAPKAPRSLRTKVKVGK